MITIDSVNPRRLAEFWSQATGFPVVADYGMFLMVGSTPPLGFQQVDEPTPGKNRVHLDGEGGDREAQVQRLCELGATQHGTHTVPGKTWTVMTDPDGNFLCVGDPEPAESEPSP